MNRLPPPNSQLLNKFNARSKLNFPSLNPHLPPPPPPRYSSTYSTETGQGINRSNRPIPSTMLQQIKSLPTELQLNFLSKLPFQELSQLCKTDKYFSFLCEDEPFWKQHFQNRFSTSRPETSWRESYILTHEAENILKSFLSILGLQDFLNLFVPELILYMKLNEKIASKYRVPLSSQDIEDLEATSTPEQISAIYDQYLSERQTLPVPDPYQLYEFRFRSAPYLDGRTPPTQSELLKLTIEGIRIGVELKNHTAAQMKALNDLLANFKNPKLFMRFLNTPIPGLQNVKIQNQNGVVWDDRSLANTSYRDGTPALNILETGEPFEITIPKPQISLLDILIGIMSVKSSKEDFYYEVFFDVVFDPVQNIIIPQLGFSS